MSEPEPVYVTKTFLPPLEEYVRYLEGIWHRNQLTNNGPLVQELERRLKEFLGVKHLLLVANGTIALQIAIKALGLRGEVITTPFSYVATTSSIVWEGCTPVFVDISPEDLCINAELIEAAITERTAAILATHVYGFPCDVDAIETVARRHGLKVIYDGAHAFGVQYMGESLLRRGDIATLSFHATKLFHTVEGGALVTDDDDLAHRIEYMRNFGHRGQEEFWGLGINGKVSEFHAAMGLCMLPHMSGITAGRRAVCEEYDRLLLRAPLRVPKPRAGTDWNYAYYPVLFPTEEDLLEVRDRLAGTSIFPRRYFYPTLDTLDYVSGDAPPCAADCARRVLCLPLSAEMPEADVRRVAGAVSSGSPTGGGAERG